LAKYFSFGVFVGMVTCAAQQLSVRERCVEPTVRPSPTSRSAPHVQEIDPITLSAAPSIERREIEREIAKLLATLSAAGVAAVAALGQAKALNLTIVGICTILLMAALAFSLKSLFALYAQAAFIVRYNRTSGRKAMPMVEADSELQAAERDTARGLKFAAIWFGASVLLIALGSTAVTNCTTKIQDPGIFDYLICSGISEFSHTPAP
jgi:Ca2+/Na+ antiporter